MRQEKGVRYRFEITNITTNRKAAEGYIAFACVEKKNGEIEATECPKELIEIWRKT